MNVMNNGASMEGLPKMTTQRDRALALVQDIRRNSQVWENLWFMSQDQAADLIEAALIEQYRTAYLDGAKSMNLDDELVQAARKIVAWSDRHDPT